MPRLYPLPPAVTSGPGLELDFEVDDQDPQYAVPCPVPWCDARKVGRLFDSEGRPVPCGAGGEPFVGLHVARIEYARTGAAKQHARVVRRWQRATGLTLEAAESAVDFSRALQRSVDRGFAQIPMRRKP